MAVACPIEQYGELVGERQRRVAGHDANMFDELKARFLGLRRKCGGLGRLQERHVEESGVAFEDLDRLGVEPTSRFVDDAPKGLVGLAIVGHGREAKQGESVLDLRAGVEADIADEAIRDCRAHQGFLEGA